MNALILAEKWALSASFTWLAAVTLAQWLRFRTRINLYPALAVGLLASVLLAGNLSTLGGPFCSGGQFELAPRCSQRGSGDRVPPVRHT